MCIIINASIWDINVLFQLCPCWIMNKLSHHEVTIGYFSCRLSQCDEATRATAGLPQTPGQGTQCTPLSREQEEKLRERTCRFSAVSKRHLPHLVKSQCEIKENMTRNLSFWRLPKSIQLCCIWIVSEMTCMIFFLPLWDTCTMYVW